MQRATRASLVFLCFNASCAARIATDLTRATVAAVRSCVVDIAIHEKAEYRAAELAHT
jgi:hypothetical protein